MEKDEAPKAKTRPTTTIEKLPDHPSPTAAKYVVKFGGAIVKFLFSEEEKTAYEKDLIVQGGRGRGGYRNARQDRGQSRGGSFGPRKSQSFRP